MSFPIGGPLEPSRYL